MCPFEKSSYLYSSVAKNKNIVSLNRELPPMMLYTTMYLNISNLFILILSS